MLELKELIIRAVKRVQSEVEFIEVDSHDEKEISMTFDCWKNDGILFESREGEEDDDWPEFIGQGKLISSVSKELGDGYKISAWDHEKGLFSIQVLKNK